MWIQRQAVSRRVCRQFYERMPLRIMPSCDWIGLSAIRLWVARTRYHDSHGCTGQNVKIIHHPAGSGRKEIVKTKQSNCGYCHQSFIARVTRATLYGRLSTQTLRVVPRVLPVFLREGTGVIAIQSCRLVQRS